MAFLMDVGLLVDVAKQLKCAADAVQENNAEWHHLFERVRDNTGLITAALLEGMSSANPELNRSLESCINRVIRTLAEARDAIYKHMLSNRVRRWKDALKLQETMAKVQNKLDKDLADLRTCISMETLRLVQGGPEAARGNGGVYLTPEAAEQLKQLREILEYTSGNNKQVVKKVARALVAPPKDQPGRVKELQEFLAKDINAPGGVATLVQLLASSRGEVRESAAGAIAELATGNPLCQNVIGGSGAIPALIKLLTGGEEAVAVKAAAALGRLALDNPRNQTAIAAAGGLNILSHLLGITTGGSQEVIAGALGRLASKNAANQAAIQQMGAWPTLEKLLGAFCPFLQRPSGQIAIEAPPQQPCPGLTARSAEAVPAMSGFGSAPQPFNPKLSPYLQPQPQPVFSPCGSSSSMQSCGSFQQPQPMPRPMSCSTSSERAFLPVGSASMESSNTVQSFPIITELSGP